MTATNLHDPATAGPAANPPPMSWGPAVILHLAPGAALLLFFAGTAPLLHQTGLPPVWGLLLGSVLVLAPIELGIVLYFARRRGQTRILPALGLKPIHRSDLGPMLLAVAASALLPGLAIGLEPVLRSHLFGWLPDWFTAGVGTLSAYPPWIVTATVALWLITMVLVGPAVEEIYFRGWLLPRLRGRGLPVAAANAALFSVYHLWQPSAVITVFLWALPLAVLVQARRNPTLSLTVHCAVNLLIFTALLTGALQR